MILNVIQNILCLLYTKNFGGCQGYSIEQNKLNFGPSLLEVQLLS